MLVRETGIHFLQQIETTDHQSGADQKYERRGHFNNYEQTAQPLPPTRATSTLFQRFVHVDFACLNRGNQTEENACHKRDPERKDEHSPVETNLARSRNRVRTDVQNETDAP